MAISTAPGFLPDDLAAPSRNVTPGGALPLGWANVICQVSQCDPGTHSVTVTTMQLIIN